jgi:hypothetical protein
MTDDGGRFATLQPRPLAEAAIVTSVVTFCATISACSTPWRCLQLSKWHRCYSVHLALSLSSMELGVFKKGHKKGIVGHKSEGAALSGPA